MIAVLSMTIGCRTTDTASTIAAVELPLSYRASVRTRQPPIDLSAIARRTLDSNLIYPGDLLDITVVTGVSEDDPKPLPYRVGPNGSVDLPLIGPVPVAGLAMTAAEEAIRTASIERRVYRLPTVAIQLNSRKTDRVLVTGAVSEPKVYELPKAGSDLLAALTAAGGLTESADTIIEIRHPASGGVRQAGFEGDPQDPAAWQGRTAESVHVDLVEAMAGQTGDLSLRDGSVVWVKEHLPETVYVHGLVKQAGEFELPKDKPLRVDQAIALAKGREMEFADTVHVTRFVPGRTEPVVINVSLKEAKSNRDANIVLMAGDVVSVEETPTTFTVDFLRNFFRIGFSSAIPGF